MAKRKGSVAKKDKGDGSSGAGSASGSPKGDSAEDACMTCSNDAGNDAIGCDKCKMWVHNSEMCSGLPQSLLDAIKEYGGRGINFVCTKCRIQTETDGSSTGGIQPLVIELVNQIFQQMKGLCSAVQNLTDRVTELASRPAPAPVPTQAPAPLPSATDSASKPNPAYQTAIRKEIQEMNEREKRRSSIIVKGLPASSPRDFTQKFSQLTQSVMDISVTLSDVTAIPGHSNIFRAKLLNDEVRKRVLDNSKTLRGTDYHGVYISRDLTYAQRAELFARRQARRAEPNGQPPVSAPQAPPGTETNVQDGTPSADPGNSLRA